MLPELKAIDYKKVLFYFSEIAAIPHGSGNVKPLADYLEGFAKEKNLRYVRDTADNVIFYAPATKGYEKKKTIILQGHMDMVCEKEADSDHNFLTDGLSLRVDGDWLSADGTTLGGDDGIAVAYFLALLSDKESVHPALEILVTTDEETGMEGAKALDGSLLSGRYLINLDSEEEYQVLCGCAGGVRLTGEFPLKRQEKKGVLIEISLNDYLGGHSGTEIDKGRVNAVLLLARLLFQLRNRIEFDLVSFFGGNKDNAIPRSAKASILFSTEKAGEGTEILTELSNSLQKEYSEAEPDGKITYQKSDKESEKMAISESSFEKLLFFLIHTPNGVQQMSAGIKDFVESSLSLGVLQMEEDKAVVTFLLRSSRESYQKYLVEKLVYFIEMFQGEAELGSEYPCWEYQADSELRKAYETAYTEMFQKQPEVAAVHAGLECGIFSEKLRNPEMISIGPDMKDIHTPMERLSISSAIRIFRLLEKILADDLIS